MTTTNTDAFSTDLVAALAELRTLQQDGANPHFKSRYMTLQTLIEGVRPILAKHHLALLQPVTADANSVTVTTVILHASGAKFDSALTLTATGPAGTVPGPCWASCPTRMRTTTRTPPAHRWDRRWPRRRRTTAGSARCAWPPPQGCRR